MQFIDLKNQIRPSFTERSLGIILTVRNVLFLFLLFIAICFSFGCDVGHRIKTYQVSGTVTCEGTPVGPGAHIRFIPCEADSTDEKNMVPTESAFSTTDKDGNYQLSSINGRTDKGALPGQYIVTVEWTKTEGSLNPQKMVQGSQSSPHFYVGKPQRYKVKDLIPSKYKDPESSGLTATVKKEKNIINLELSTK